MVKSRTQKNKFEDYKYRFKEKKNNMKRSS